MTTEAKAGSGKKARGAFILFEGLDRCGKTTHSKKLSDFLTGAGHPSKLLRYPDRTTDTGKMIDSYLKNSSNLDDRAIHLLFSANRWEQHASMISALESGTTLVVDRYSYSGVAYSASKGLDVEWCMNPERGLPAPDVVIYMTVTMEEAQKRGGFGEERYEKKETQEKVAKVFQQLKNDKWRTVDANDTVDKVHDAIKAIALQTVKDAADKPIGKL